MVLNENPVYFLKFGREKDLKALCAGDIYTNNAEFFTDLEKKTDIKKCIGDENENKIAFYSENVKLKNKYTNESLCLNTKFTSTLSYNADLKKAMFCLYSLYQEDFKVDSDNKGCKLVLNDVKKKYILNNFVDGDRDSVIIIPAKPFIESIVSKCNIKNIECVHGSVNYYESGVPYKEQFINFKNRELGRFFWKEEYYSNQYEYRFIFNKDIDKGQVLINIGEILPNYKPIKVDDFINKYDVIVFL